MTPSAVIELRLTIEQLQTLAAFALTIEPERISDLLVELERTDALGPILDPTWYRSALGDLGGLRELAKAALPLIRHANTLPNLEPAEDPHACDCGFHGGYHDARCRVWGDR